MVITNNHNEDKLNRKLSIQVALNGLSFCCHNTQNNTITSFKEISFSDDSPFESIESNLWKTFLDHSELTRAYDEIVVLYENSLNTFVPKSLFDEDYKGSYLQYNNKVFETDFFTFDPIEKHNMVNVFVPYVNINNFFIDQFDTFEFKHASSVLVSQLLDYSKNEISKNMFLNVGKNHFEIIVIQNQKLILFNSFEYSSPEDFVYYLLFTAEQLNMNPDQFSLFMLGNIDENHELFQLAYKYVRNISLFKVDATNNAFSDYENYKHFTLFNS